MREPLTVEVIARVLSSFDHCSHCQLWLNGTGVGPQVHREDFLAFPQAVREEHDRLVALVETLGARFGGRVRFRILDPQTLDGVWTSIRHWVRQYPTFLIEGEKVVGWDEHTLGCRIEAHLHETSPGNGDGVWGSLRRGVSDFIYGMAVHEMTRQAQKTRGSMERLFILMTMGDLLGIPVLPPYYALRIVPYAVPRIAGWKRSMLRERDLTDAIS